MLKNNKEYQAAYDILTSIEDASAIQEELTQQMSLLSADIVNSAIDDNGNGDFKSSTEKLYLAYIINTQENQDYLYFAASSAVNAELYEIALDYYLQLKELNYTGVVTKYFVTEKETTTEIEVTKSEYDLYKKI